MRILSPAFLLASGLALAASHLSDSVLIAVPHADGRAFGLGALPLGFRAALDERKPLGAFVDLSAGIHYFSQPVPEVKARRLSAQLMAGAGLHQISVGIGLRPRKR